MSPAPSSQERHFAYYSSGHGYGHATRVSAVTSSLLAAGHAVTIVTNAPTQPFSAVLPSFNGSPNVNTLPRYATYRFANIDAGIVQPKAYDVDRKATFEVLKTFMEKREERLDEEEKWLREAGVDAVLSDAAFLACAAADRAGIPSVLISNFTFDSCYSYLSLPPLPPRAFTSSSSSDEEPEPALPASLLLPFVSQAIADYQHASLLLRLPGSIPIPAFDTDVSLPAGTWVNAARTAFTPPVLSLLSRPPSSAPCTSPHSNTLPRRIVDVPLIVRPPSPNVHSPAFRAALLSSLGVPASQHSHKVLLVSFGGQSIPRPRSRPPSPMAASTAQGSSFEANVDGFLRGGREAGLLPPGWIAIVCGLSGEGNEIRKDLPAGFFASEKDVYVPDLTATADVVLGKLGYGTCSETLSCHTPFVYVPRPLFVEEFGLKRLMQQRGTSLELDRADFEAGRWEFHIAEAHKRGKEEKEESRRVGYVCEGAGRVIVQEIERFLEESQ